MATAISELSFAIIKPLPRTAIPIVWNGKSNWTACCCH
jgi:hypothetical protein